MKLLLIDDEPGIREGLAALLRLKGNEVCTAGDIAAAEEALASQNFDAIVTDWSLPDGNPDQLYGMVDTPFVVVSGHPEQVQRADHVARVLAKPVMPTSLIDVLEEVIGVTDPLPSSSLELLPRDVRGVLERAIRLIGADRARVIDDGTFLTLTARWPGDAMRASFEELGGDLRVLMQGGESCMELRWCRDGRPDPSLLKVHADQPWPLVDELCVEFHDTEVGIEEFERCVDRACAWRADGRRVHFLNVPAGLLAAIEGSGRAADLPMKERIGPRIPASLQDLWS